MNRNISLTAGHIYNKPVLNILCANYLNHTVVLLLIKGFMLFTSYVRVSECVRLCVAYKRCHGASKNVTNVTEHPYMVNTFNLPKT